MEYSPENVLLLLTKLRIRGLKEPDYWVLEDNLGDKPLLTIRWVPYSQLPELRQINRWYTFVRDVNMALGEPK